MSVFLSYSSKDKNFARRLKKSLQQAGVQVWLDEIELHVGDDLAAIESAIREAGCMVVVMSAAAARSSWVEKEVRLARRLGEIKILPVLLEDIPEEWELAGKAIADFRDPAEYWRSLHRLISAITGKSDPRRSAKQAAIKAKAEMNPSGELFGLSQQGVATLYTLANTDDWDFADAMSGASRLWIAEFYDPQKSCIQAYAVVADRIDELPTLFLLDSDPQPMSDSVIVYSSSLGPGLPEKDAQALMERAGDQFRHVEKRYTRFRPIPLPHSFVDSDVAVARAIQCGQERGAFTGNEELFVLAKLECDKHYRGLPTWKVSFFDPALLESVLTVGVDAVTGAVTHPAMHTEILNANFFHMKSENGNIVIDIGHQFKAIDNQISDVHLPGEPAEAGLTAGEAIDLTGRLLASEPTRQWQLAFLSNTGVVASVVSPHISSPTDGLMRLDGTAGQWVIEVYSGEPQAVSDGKRNGYAYDFRQILVTRKEGAVAVDSVTTWAFTVPLSRCPLPHHLLDAYEKARVLAIRCATVDFRVMSVALDRPKGGPEWCFRFYGLEDLLLALRVSGDGMRVIA